MKKSEPRKETWCKYDHGRGGKPLRGKGSYDADRKRVGKEMEAPPRKAAIAIYGPVPKTDTGRQVEETKADGRSIVKELGKITP